MDTKETIANADAPAPAGRRVARSRGTRKGATKRRPGRATVPREPVRPMRIRCKQHQASAAAIRGSREASARPSPSLLSAGSFAIIWQMSSMRSAVAMQVPPNLCTSQFLPRGNVSAYSRLGRTSLSTALHLHGDAGRASSLDPAPNEAAPSSSAPRTRALCVPGRRKSGASRPRGVDAAPSPQRALPPRRGLGWEGGGRRLGLGETRDGSRSRDRGSAPGSRLRPGRPGPGGGAAHDAQPCSAGHRVSIANSNQ